jgi:branched-chain amino acid transport system substrate-binding protein
MLKFYVVVLAILSLLCLSACNEESNEPIDTGFEPVRIGVLIPLNRTYYEFGEDFKNAADLAANHLKTAGYTVELFEDDSQGNKEIASNKAKTLFFQKQIHALICCSSSVVTLEVAKQVSIDNNLPQIAYSASSVEITHIIDQDFLFRTNSSDKAQGTVLARLVYEAGYRNVVIFYINDAFGTSLMRQFEQNFQRLNEESIYIYSVKHEKQEEQETYLTQLLEAKHKIETEGIKDEKTVLIPMSFVKQAKIYLKQAIDNNLFKEFWFVGSTKSKELIEAVGKKDLEGMCGTVSSGLLSSPSLEKFQESYNRKYGESQASFLPNLYDAIVLVALAAYSAQAMGEALTPLTVRDHLRKVAGWPGKQIIAGPKGLREGLVYLLDKEAINYVGASGGVDFDENGDVVTPVEIWCYENGEIVVKDLEKPCLLCGKK